jgi:hypothetical protein
VDDELKNMAASTKEQTSALNKLSGDTATGFDGLKAILTDIRDLIKSLVDEMKNSLTQAGSGNTSGTGDQNSLPGQANSLGENLATGLAKGIKSGIPSVKNSFNLLNSAVSDSLNAMNVIGLAGHNLTQAPQAQGDAQTVDGGTLGWSSAGDGSGSSGNSGSSPSLGGSGSSGNSGSSTSSGGFGDVVTNVNLDGKQIAQNVTDNQQTQKQRQLGSGFQAGLF